MLFNSYIFWLFFAIVFVLYQWLNHGWQNRMLLVASYVFYGWWDVRFLILILIATVVNYLTAIGIGTSDSIRRRKILLTIALVVSLGMLGMYKYYDFFVGEFVIFLEQYGVSITPPLIHILLPVGISFYTFQTLSYTIDVYRGKTPYTTHFWDFALYVSFFPQLVAGPIERSSHLLPQVLQPRTIRSSDYSEGLYLVMLGLFKKMVVADNMASVANTIFSQDLDSLSGFEVLLGVYAFAFQIYCDFSGYSAIARGVAKWLGFDLMVNFRMPYFAQSPREFWQRWHISLSTWLRDYLYIPLGGSRGSKINTYRNLGLTMLLGGLWHGANWTFIAWGAFHGFILCLHRFLFFKSNSTKVLTMHSWWQKLLAIFIMFHLVCISWLFFRADTITQAVRMFMRLFTDFRITDFGLFASGMIAFYVLPLILFEYWIERKGNLLALTEIHWGFRSAAYSYGILMMWFFMPRIQHAFIYFQF
ncbi:MAG: MBOAT family O-acyltransferase [Pirellulales bacterium]